MTKVPNFNKLDDFNLDQNFNYIQQLLQNLTFPDNFINGLPKPVSAITSTQQSGTFASLAAVTTEYNKLQSDFTNLRNALVTIGLIEDS